MEIVVALLGLVAAAGGYLMWRDRRRAVSADESTPPPATDAERHGIPGTRHQWENGAGI